MRSDFRGFGRRKTKAKGKWSRLVEHANFPPPFDADRLRARRPAPSPWRLPIGLGIFAAALFAFGMGLASVDQVERGIVVIFAAFCVLFMVIASMPD